MKENIIKLSSERFVPVSSRLKSRHKNDSSMLSMLSNNC